jgi:SAM-dependent methyltransferase
MAQVRASTYGEDLGQSSWMSADELRQFLNYLELKPSFHMLEVGSGSGGSALFIANTIGCRVTGIDINEHGIRNANEMARNSNMDGRAHFQTADASQRLPFEDQLFEGILCNDAMCHISRRTEVLKDWFRVLKPGGRMLYTDAMVITGLLSDEEIRTRSSIGDYFFLPPGENERLIRAAGFELVRVEDVTAGALTIAERWHQARARHAKELLQIEGAENFEGLQRFLFCVQTLSAQRRLCRYCYLGEKP